jgi:hypothetical protein
MPRVRVADGNDVGLLLAQVITGLRRAGVGYDNSLLAFDAKAGMSEPGDFHSSLNLAVIPESRF